MTLACITNLGGVMSMRHHTPSLSIQRSSSASLQSFGQDTLDQEKRQLQRGLYNSVQRNTLHCQACNALSQCAVCSCCKECGQIKCRHYNPTHELFNTTSWQCCSTKTHMHATSKTRQITKGPTTIMCSHCCNTAPTYQQHYLNVFKLPNESR